MVLVLVSQKEEYKYFFSPEPTLIMNSTLLDPQIANILLQEGDCDGDDDDDGKYYNDNDCDNKIITNTKTMTTITMMNIMKTTSI